MMFLRLLGMNTSTTRFLGTVIAPLRIPVLESGDLPFGSNRISTFPAVPPIDRRSTSPLAKSVGVSRSSHPEPQREDASIWPNRGRALDSFPTAKGEMGSINKKLKIIAYLHV